MTCFDSSPHLFVRIKLSASHFEPSTGTAACQLAKMHGCRVLASAGSEAKVAFLAQAHAEFAHFAYQSAASEPRPCSVDFLVRRDPCQCTLSAGSELPPFNAYGCKPFMINWLQRFGEFVNFSLRRYSGGGIGEP